MPTAGRAFVDGNNDARTLEVFVDPTSGWERLGYYDPETHTKLEQVKNAIEAQTSTQPTVTISAMGTTTSEVIVAATQKILFSIAAMNTGNGIRYLQIFDRSNALAPGVIPLVSVPVYPDSGWTVVDQQVLGVNGLSLNNGLVWGMSTTPGIFTAATAAECFVFGRAA